MKRRAIWPLALLVFTGISLVAYAQQRHEGEIHAELSLVWGFAQGTFGNNLGRPIPGLVFSFGGRTPDLPLVLSTEIGWLNYGFDDYLELQFPSGATTSAPAVSVVSVETNNSILMAHLAARLVPFRGKISPYIGGLIGFKYFITKAGIESGALFDADDLITIADDDRLFTSSTFNSLALSYGMGAGINIQIFRGPLGLHNQDTTILMHLGVRYLFGSEADYLTENSIRPQAGRIRFEQVESDTDMLIPQLGIRFGL